MNMNQNKLLQMMMNQINQNKQSDEKDINNNIPSINSPNNFSVNQNQNPQINQMPNLNLGVNNMNSNLNNLSNVNQCIFSHYYKFLTNILLKNGLK